MHSQSDYGYASPGAASMRCIACGSMSLDCCDGSLPSMNELPDDLRVPLHELQADLDWMLARYLAEDREVRDMLKNSIRSRLSQIETAAYRLANPPRASLQTREAV